ncbi:MAG: leucine-rich repeat domain-containing protein [Anaerolineales bacterium]
MPPEIGSLTNLHAFYFDGNQLASLPPEFSSLTGLAYLSLAGNQFSTFPAEIVNFPDLIGLNLSGNQLTSLPPEIGNLSGLYYLYLSDNQLIDLPPEIGNLTFLFGLTLANNQLTQLPREITNLEFHQWEYFPPTYLFDLSYNRLSLSDPALIHYAHRYDPDWADTQTISPTNVQLHSAAPGSLTLSWTPIRYASGPGYYELSLAEDPAGPYTVVATTPDKTSIGFTAFRLPTRPATYLRLRTFSAAHDDQLQDLWSEYSETLAILTSSVSPSEAASLSYTDDQDQITQVEVPAGAVSTPGTLYFSSPVPIRLERNFTFNGLAFKLGLYQNGAYTEARQLSAPLTLTLTYQEGSLTPEHLRLVYWDPVTRGWLDAVQTCSLPGTVEHRTEAHQLVVPVCQLGTYALVAAQPIQYLPAIRQSR